MVNPFSPAVNVLTHPWALAENNMTPPPPQKNYFSLCFTIYMFYFVRYMIYDHFSRYAVVSQLNANKYNIDNVLYSNMLLATFIKNRFISITRVTIFDNLPILNIS